MTSDLHAHLRRRKPEKRRARLVRRPRETLGSIADLSRQPQPALLLDTNIYILNASGRLPGTVAACLDRSRLFHCSVCLSEIAAGIANAALTRGWSTIRDHYATVFASIPTSRLLVPDAATWIDAGLVAGTLARLQDFQREQRKECLNDALIFLTAARAGLPVLTADRADYDLIQQLAPEGRFFSFDL
ncbi:type II toxin-antitoxin system VapC family toxin [Methylobacterium platani]|uniref:DNA-binding protein n=2 Tax=Methylobacterium platani TaxID=427683 RepID=A0A179SL02_9HYPH|nr:type II toxin-antitoxin system VapC family toxin [Methylobacterium platani]KMO16107.1 DNA-binding protein [Methylobacterium platani JCM 14648]OAS27690.1 DNA-binding protein [Methylobacterium platani]